MLSVLRDTQIYREVTTLILLIYLKIECYRILATGTGVALFVLLGYRVIRLRADITYVVFAKIQNVSVFS